MVRILHSSGSNCSDYQTCATKVLGLQSIHVGEDGLPDIAYNFLIGGDGNVYIGRGAEVQPEGSSNSIDIAYVGNYLGPYDRVSDKMDEAGRNLITRLLEREKISKDYKVGWNAKPPLKVTKFSGPVKMVRIMHTGGSNCHDLEICAKKVNSLQGWQIGTKGMPDLQYNYMIGGDGNVYVARGPENQGEIRSDSIDIGYMGNFLTPYDKMTDKMEQAGKRLIVKLEKDGYITPDYIVVAQNQTVFTQSPGQNIYKKIVHWPHYDSGIYF